MIRINLLPHREEKRKAKRQQFYALSGLVVVLAALMVFFGWTLNERAITAQQEKNGFLKAEIEKLDKQIAQIKSLKDEISILLKKKEIIETLQRDRGMAVTLLVEIARQVPEGAYLKSLKQTGPKVALTGVSQSNSRVSELMRNLAQSTAFENPRLIETKAVTVDKKKMQDFSMTVDIKPIKLESAVAPVATQKPAVVEAKK
jgi:type IV pilus assembly protein PilN